MLDKLLPVWTHVTTAEDLKIGIFERIPIWGIFKPPLKSVLQQFLKRGARLLLFNYTDDKYGVGSPEVPSDD